MNPTPSLQQWTRDFADLEAERAGSEPGWLHATRKAALVRFGELGFPTRRQEAWKYTNAAPIAKQVFRRAAAPTRRLDAADLGRLGLPVDGAGRIVFVNGRHAANLGRLDGLDPRLELDALARRLDAAPESLEPHLTRLAGGEAQPFVALNTAFLADGACLRLPAGVELDEPIFLIFLTLPGAEPVATHPRVLVVAEPGSRATVVELHASAGEGIYLSNAVTEVVVGENAAVEHVKLQLEGPRAFHVATLHALQQRASRFTSHSLSFGAALARNEVTTVLGAEGAECTLNGLYVASGRQHADQQTTIDHRRPHGTSRELYKGILGDAARGVFNGKILVRPDAQRTDARQRNDNLLLDSGADVNTKPQLEIHADDVKCSHGSTIGHLDQDALFYLRSRGLDDVAARGILTRGFAAEVTQELGFEPLRAWVEERVVERLFDAGSRP